MKIYRILNQFYLEDGRMAILISKDIANKEVEVRVYHDGRFYSESEALQVYSLIDQSKEIKELYFALREQFNIQ